MTVLTLPSAELDQLLLDLANNLMPAQASKRGQVANFIRRLQRVGYSATAARTLSQTLDYDYSLTLSDNDLVAYAGGGIVTQPVPAFRGTYPTAPPPDALALVAADWIAAAGTTFIADSSRHWVLDGVGSGAVSGQLLIQDEGTGLTQRAILNFVGAGVTASDDSAGARTVVTIAGPTPRIQVKDEGVSLTQRDIIDFVGAGVSVTDDNSGGGRTVVNVPGAEVIWYNGTPVTTRGILNFTGGGLTVTDDGTHAVTVINVPTPSVSGGGSTLQVQDEGSNVTVRTKLNFVGTGVTVTDDSAGGRTTISIPAAAVQVQSSGTNVTQRAILDFVGAGVSIADDSANSRTVITIAGGSGGVGGSSPWVSGDSQADWLLAGTSAGKAAAKIKAATSATELVVLADQFNNQIGGVHAAGGLWMNDWMKTTYSSAVGGVGPNYFAADIYGFRSLRSGWEYAYPGPPGNMLPWNDSVHEVYDGSRAGSIGNWQPAAGTTVAAQQVDQNSSPTGYSGALVVTSTATSGTAGLVYNSSAAVPVDQTMVNISLVLWVKGVNFAAARLASASLGWSDSTHSNPTTSPAGAAVAVSNAGWTKIVCLASVPAGYVYTQPLVSVACLSGEQFLICGIAVFGAAQNTYAPPFAVVAGAAPAGSFWRNTLTSEEFFCPVGGLPYQQRWVNQLDGTAQLDPNTGKVFQHQMPVPRYG